MNPVIEEVLITHILLSVALTIATAGLFLYIYIAKNKKREWRKQRN